MRTGVSNAVHGAGCRLARFSLPGLHAHSSLRAANTLFSGEYEERFRAGMTVNRCRATWRSAGVVDTKQISRCGDAWNRTGFGNLICLCRGFARGPKREQPHHSGGFGDKRPKGLRRRLPLPAN